MERDDHAALLRLEDASATADVPAGEDLHILCADRRFGRRRFVAETQGLAGGREVFHATITGIGV